VDGAPNGISVPRWSLSRTPSEGKPSSGKSITVLSSVTRVGLDLAKSEFQVHAVDARGEVVVALALKRAALLKLFERLPSCPVAMEACSSAHHWARQLMALGFEVVVPDCVREALAPLVRQIDALDAAIGAIDKTLSASVPRSRMRAPSPRDASSQPSSG
jgi:hypothetical protein